MQTNKPPVAATGSDDKDYRALAFNAGFEIKDTEDGYTWSARNWVDDSAEEFPTLQEAWENIVARYPNAVED